MVRLVISFFAVLLATSGVFSRSILEKKMYYVQADYTVTECKYWAIYLGNQQCKLMRKYPGETEAQVDASVNFQFLSSGYIEGNGYGKKGKIECLPVMLLKTETEEVKVEIDSVDFIYGAGKKMCLLNGKCGDFIMDIEGDKRAPNRFILREYKLTDFYGEQILKEGSEEKPIIAFAYTKEGAQRAVKALKATVSK